MDCRYEYLAEMRIRELEAKLERAREQYGDLLSEYNTLCDTHSRAQDRLIEVIEYTAPCVFHGNAHADCVQHSGQAPCMTQTESDWLAEMQKERDALAALDAIHYLPGGEIKAELRDAYDDTPETSLARLKAKWQAEALYEFTHGSYIMPATLNLAMCKRANELRRQAEDPTHE